MDNNKLPACPVDGMAWANANNIVRKDGPMTPWSGFTKLEKAALMIAQGFISGRNSFSEGNEKKIASGSVAIAKAVLEEANK